MNSDKSWLTDALFGLWGELRWSYLPPLMVYLAAGVSGLTAIVGTFFVKDYLGLSAAFLAGLGFWAGIPWALKMPLGHIVDLIWRWKAVMVYLGAVLIALSIGIMYLLITRPESLTPFMSAEAWFVLSVLLAPSGYVVQDVVADAMTVEAVPLVDADGVAYDDAAIKSMHTTMQTLGRFAIIGGTVLVAAANVTLFAGVDALSEAEKVAVYADIYALALAIPVMSVLGVTLGALTVRRRARRLRAQGTDEARIAAMLYASPETPRPDGWILGGSLAFVVFTLSVGLSDLAFAQEIVFAGSMGIVLVLLYRLLLNLDEPARKALVGTAVIIFVFRAVPLPGAGQTWFEIDVLGFDQQFLSVLSLITSCLALAGMVLLRPLMAQRSIAWLVGMLTVAGGLFSLPNIGLYYGVHEWTSGWSAGVIDARFIAIFDTALESPLGQIAMIPMLAWIARNAPSHLKATFFAVMASFTNLALSASSLATRYLNDVFVVTREVRDRDSGALAVAADYAELGVLLITVAVLTVGLPLLAIALVQRSALRTRE